MRGLDESINTRLLIWPSPIGPIHDIGFEPKKEAYVISEARMILLDTIRLLRQRTAYQRFTDSTASSQHENRIGKKKSPRYLLLA